MLISVAAKNFLSFEDTVKLDMSASEGGRKAKYGIGSNGIHQFAALYGETASGKTNLVKILKFIQQCVTEGIPTEAEMMYCRRREENKDQESLFELLLETEGILYSYSFVILLKERRIISEQICEIGEDGSVRVLFQKESGKKAVLAKGVIRTEKDAMKWDVYCSDYEVQAGKLFLTFMNEDKRYQEDASLDFFQDIYKWIKNSIRVYRPDAQAVQYESVYDEVGFRKMAKLLKAFDMGVTEIELVECALSKLKAELTEVEFQDLLDDLTQELQSNTKNIVFRSMRIHDHFFQLTYKKDGKLEVDTIQLYHEALHVGLSFEEEAAGTRRLFELFDLLLSEKKDRVYVLDGLDTGLHPLVVKELIRLFEEIPRERKIQFILISSRGSLPVAKSLRDEEIWFLNKDTKGCSQLCTLDHLIGL